MVHKSESSEKHYEHIAQQINKEDSLIDNRSTWILTINIFLFFSAGFLGNKNIYTEEIITFSHLTLPIIGIVVSFAGLCWVTAAHLHLHYLTKKWNRLNEGSLVRPFGRKRLSICLNLLSNFLPSVILIIVWLHLSVTWQSFNF